MFLPDLAYQKFHVVDQRHQRVNKQCSFVAVADEQSPHSYIWLQM